MNRRQRIIVSVTGIFIVLLILIGLTYAYFLTRITGNSNPTSISVTTANLELVYGDGTTSILTSSTPIEPGKFSSSKDFTVTNNGNALTDYAVTLEDFAIYYANDTVINGQQIKAGTVTKMEYPDDMKMTLTCLIESEVEERNGKECSNKITEGTLPTENSILLVNSIEKGDTHKYELTLIYEDSGIDQSKDMNKTIKGKIDIIDTKSTIDLTGTVATYQTGDYVEINSTPIKSEIVDGKYKLIGVEPGSHTLNIKYKDTNGDIQTRGSQTLIIKKGDEESVNGNVISFTDESRVATVNINTDYTLTLDENVKNLFYGKTISNALMSNSKIKKNFSTPEFKGVATEEEGMYSAEDDYGYSYYFRGAQSNNYVKFAGFTWRIVRINGDGTVRLILDGTLDLLKREGLDVYAGTTSAFKLSPYNDNAYIGYMYGLAGTTTDANRCLMLIDGMVTDKVSDYSTQDYCEFNGGKWTTTAYEATHANLGSSTIKTNVDTFYETYIENDTNNYHYEKYMSDNIMCGDKTLADISIGDGNTALGYGGGTNYKTYYSASERLYYSIGTTSITTAYPTLKCSEGATNDYSRYTVDEQIINSIQTNGDLKYPIGLLSADELIMAGAFSITKNFSYYLYDSYKYGLGYDHWWLMTPTYSNNGASIFRGYSTLASLSNNNGRSSAGVRPVINLKADLLIKSGDGTENSPYEIMEIN